MTPTIFRYLGAIPLLILVSGVGNAQVFSAVVPPDCPSYQEVAYNYNVSTAGTGEWELPNDHENLGQYENNINNRRHFTANARVSFFGFRMDHVNFEANWDHFKVANNGSVSTFTGTPALGWYDFGTNFIQENPAWLTFSSDTSFGGTGLVIGKARVCTTTWLPTFNQAVIQARDRYTGVLLGTNDVVYLRAKVGNQKIGESCTTAHDTFALWGQIGAQNDFDIYGRCGALPTPTTFDFRGFSSDNQEFVHPTPSQCPCGSDWFIAVHSFSGSGQFNLVQHKHFANEHKTVATGAIHCQADPSKYAEYRAGYQNGFRHFFGAMEGITYYDTLELRNNNYGSALIRWKCHGGRAHAGICSNDVELFYGTHHDVTLSHELGHRLACLDDEYSDAAGIFDAHTIMGDQWRINNNFCYCIPWSGSSSGSCPSGQGDHNRDSTPPGLAPPNKVPGWWVLRNRYPYQTPNYFTPDNFDYINFDFNGIYGTVVDL